MAFWKKKTLAGGGTRRIAARLGAITAAVAIAAALLVPSAAIFAAGISDGNTSKDYSWSLGSKSSTQYNGRVWTDKSVSTESVAFTGDAGESVTVPIGEGEDASDFLVTYSALATSQQVSGESNVPVDVVFVIDNSNSMDEDLTRNQTRLEATVSAVNSSIAQIMETSPDSRVAVVVYGSSAETLLPLGHYEPMWNGNYITVNGNYTGDNSSRTEFTASGNHSLEMTGRNRGTNIHMGVDTGMDILKNATNIGEGADKHVPALVLLSDGAATYSGAGNWWNPSGSSGTGSDTNNAHALKVAMNAQYNKQLVNQHYGVTDEDSAYACQVYTIGMGIEQLNSGRDRSDYYRAQMALDPGAHLTDNNNVANAIEEAWDWYINGKTVSTGPFWDPDYETTYTPDLNGYTFEHPGSNDISTIAYNDGYYSAENAEDVASVFDDITTSIITARPQVPTKVESGNPVEDGYITYTDYIGDYMEVDSVKTLVWAGKEFKNPQVSGQGTADVTYTFEGEIQNPAYENAQNANQIQITVHTDTAADGTKTQTLTVKIPATAIPLRVNTVELSENAQGETTVVSNTPNDAYPLRLVYGVSLQDGIDSTTLEGVSDEYIAANTEDGKVNFYSNKYTGQTQGDKTVGDAKVEFTPADNNPFYFLQENTPIYTSQTGNDRVTRDNFNENATYWVPVTYYDGNQVVNTRVERAASTMIGYIGYEEGENFWDPDYAYIEAGAPRLGNLTDVVRDKGANTTDTAETSLYPTFEGDDVHNGKFVVYLGNNGKLQLDAPASLIIAKDVTADEGLTAPDATFTFEVTSEAKAGSAVSATITTGSGQTATTEDTTVQFNADGVATVTLKADQSIELKGMAGADYSIKETSLPSGFDFNKVEGADQTTGSGNDTVASGTVQTGAEDETVTFTNNYSVESVTSKELGIDLGGTKTITGRSFQEDDTFTFTIAAGRLTPDAPLPSATEGGEDFVTITPNSGDSATFEFDTITFTEPGEYCYIIRETDPTAGGTNPGEGLGGVDYDTAVYRISVVIVDNGDGTLRLATTDEIAGMETQVENYTSNPMIQELVGTGMTGAEAIQFENSYNSESTTATIQGMKVLNVTNSDYRLQDGDFTFTIEALGSNTDGGDQFTADETQPMPVDQNDDELTQTTNVANGNVRFDFADDVFTQDMVGKTFGYKITEANPSPEGSIMSNGVTYDTSEKIVKITVTDDGQGNVIAQVTPNTAGEGDPAVNFTFTNSYKPEEVTTDTDTQTLIKVKKTFTGLDWGEGFEFELKAVSNTAGIEVADMPRPKDADGIQIGAYVDEAGVRTGNFNSMTFKKAGEYTYQVTEKLPEGVTAENNTVNGITYDTHTAQVTITVSEDSSTGKLSVTEVSYDNTEATTEDDRGYSGAAAFTNTYDATFDTGTAVNLDGTKNLTVGGNSTRTLGAGQFYAVVTALDGAPLGDAAIAPGATTNSIANTADDSADNGVFTGFFEDLLNNITFKLSDLNGAASRDFVYLISEQQGNATGVTYDQSVYQVTVTVTDDGKGTLSADKPEIVKGTMQDGQFVADQSQDGVDGVVFNNSYAPLSQTVTPLSITKELSGNRNTPLQAGEFEFKIELSDGDATGVTLPTDTTVENDADGKVQFGYITFTKVGTYKIKVTEVIPEGATENGDGTYTLKGVTYDTHSIETTFTVTDANGQLQVSRTGTSGSQTFTNEYTSTGTTNAALTGTKYISGRDFMKGDTFTFDIAGAYKGAAENVTAPLPENVTASEDNAAQGTITIAPESGSEQAIDFGDITFTKPGTYTYTLSEQDVSDAVVNVTKDSTVYTVTYTVTDDGDGTMTVSDPIYAIQGAEEGAEAPAALSWTNTYKAEETTDVPAGFKFTKQFTSHEWTDNYSFEFTLTAQDSKLADGTPVVAADVPMPASSTKTVNAPDKEGGDTATFDFGSISYDKAGTYNYTVTETHAGETLKGITYDAQPAQVTVTVTEGKDSTGALTGRLVATATVTNGDFVNDYNTSAEYNADGAGGLDITKQVTNHAMAENQFSFTIMATGNNADAAAKKLGIQNGVSIEVKSAAAAAGVATSVKNNPFETVTFDKSDDGVTYTYTIEENGKTGEGDYKNYVLDTNIYTVAITPTDNGDGTMSVKTVVNDGVKDTEYSNKQRATVAFVNSYNADPTTVGAKGDATIKGTKTLKNDDIANYTGDNAFKFQVKSGDVVVAVGTNDANGNITFGDITYTTENLAAAVNGGSDEVGRATPQTTDAGTVYTFNYTVSEVDPDPNQTTGVTANSGSQKVTVTVTDDGNGTLKPAVTYVTGESLNFENTYGGDADFPLDITGTKEIVGGQTNPTNIPTLKGGEYVFTIAGSPAEDGTPAPMPATTMVTNDAAGGVTFEDIHYTMENTFGNKPETANVDAEAAADETTTDEAATDEGIETYTAGRTKEFTYTISESGSVAGVTNEQGTKTVTVKVTDLGGGDIKAEVTSEKTAEGADFKFTNVYDVTPEDSSLTGDGGFTITKDFTSTNTGRTLAEGDFTFELKGKDGSVVKSAKNAADGTVSFEGITFTKPGTYEYTLSELNEGKPGVTYDNKIYNVTATVEDQGNGTLEVKWEMPQAADSVVTFKNTYTAENGSITLKAAKVLQGRDLADGEFTFELRENGKVIDTATNNADGEVAFKTIEYTEPGEHDYEIVEVAGTAEGVTYDTTVHTMHVSVTDNPNTGKLEVNWAYGENGAPVFTNTYTEPAVPVEPGEPTEPAKPADNLPVTGDYTLPIVGGIVVAGAALIIGGRIMKKRGE